MYAHLLCGVVNVQVVLFIDTAKRAGLLPHDPIVFKIDSKFKSSNNICIELCKGVYFTLLSFLWWWFSPYYISYYHCDHLHS